MQSIIQEYSKVTGTNNIVLTGAVPGKRRVGFAYDEGDTVHYYIYHNDRADEWEQGIGTFRQASNTLERTTVTGSSNEGSKTEFSAGDKTVIVAMRNVVPTFATDPAGVGKGEMVLVDGTLKVGDGSSLVEAGGSMTGAEIKTAYEAEADTNAYTDAEKTKLAGLQSGSWHTFLSNPPLSSAYARVTSGTATITDGTSANGVMVLATGTTASSFASLKTQTLVTSMNDTRWKRALMSFMLNPNTQSIADAEAAIGLGDLAVSGTGIVPSGAKRGAWILYGRRSGVTFAEFHAMVGDGTEQIVDLGSIPTTYSNGYEIEINETQAILRRNGNALATITIGIEMAFITSASIGVTNQATAANFQINLPGSVTVERFRA